MTEPNSANDYGDRGAPAVYSVLLEIGQVLGAYRDQFVVIGGSVPWLLFPDAVPAHVRAALTLTQLSIPVVDGAMVLGTWQGLYLFEHRRVGSRRQVAAHVSGE